MAQDSGSFPRFDRIIASILCRQENLKTSFGLKVQAYVEKCEASGENIRGRYILNLIASEYDTNHATSSITTSIELFQLPAPHDTFAGLKLWHDKVTYILSQLSTSQQPPDDMLSQWAYGSLKKHSLMRRVIDRYLEVPAFRTFEYLWEGVELALKESQYDTNAQSIRDDLRKGPTTSPKKPDTKAMPANPKGKGTGTKGATKGDKNPKGDPKNSKESKGKANKAEGPKPKAGSQGKTSKEGTPPPCIFFARGKCTRTNCPFAHTNAPALTSTTEGSAAAPKAQPKAKAIAAAVALLAGADAAAASSMVSGNQGFIESIGDTGAGECLGSPEALARQGIVLDSGYGGWGMSWLS